MILDDLEHENGVFMDFLVILGCDAHFKRQPAYEAFSIKRSFHLFKFCIPAFKEFSIWGH